ncbi:hypothetical protein LTR94_038520, partial [Friedmanniomyces endolithicus]
PGTLPHHARHHRLAGAADGPVRHGGRHDRDLRRLDPDRRQQSGATGARHLGGAVQHRLRPGDRDAGP